MTNGLVVFGGSFDPPHLGHLIIARWVQEYLKLPIHFVPAAWPVHKDTLSPGEQRLNMLTLALAGQDGFVLDKTEFETNRPSFTVDTLVELARRHQLSREQLYLLVGGDSVLNLVSWHKPRQIGRHATLLICSRGAAEHRLRASCSSLGLERIIVMDVPLIEISSSLIRERVALAKPIDLLVPSSVNDYIRDHKLYQGIS